MMLRILRVIFLLAMVLGPSAVSAQSDELDALEARIADLYRAAKYAEAIPLAERFLALAKDRYGEQHARYATGLNDLALIYERLGRYGEAQTLAVRALAIREKALDPFHRQIATSLYTLAVLHQVGGRYSKAEAFYKRSLSIREKALGPDDPLVAVSLNVLAEFYRVSGRYAEAEPLYRRALAIIEKARGPNHPEVGAVLNNLALLHERQGRYEEAESLLNRDLAITEKSLSPDDPQVAASLNNMAGLYRTLGRYAEAEPLLKRSLAIWEKSLGPDHPNVSTSLNNLALLYQYQDRHGEAEQLYRRSLAIIDKTFGPDHPRAVFTAGNLGALLKTEGRIEEAETLLKRALDAGERVLGSKHPQVIGAMIHLAELYGLQGRIADARRLFAEAGAAKSVNLKAYPVYFGTNRQQDAKQKRIAFGSERNLSGLAFGVVNVVVQSPRPSADRHDDGKALTTVGDVRQLSIQPVILLKTDQLVRAARKRLFGARAYLGQALVFVHGFNNSFDTAVRRAGQLAYDLGFDGPVFVFSWPVRESWLPSLVTYIGARDNAEFSADSLREFLETVVAGTKAKRIHIIAHSMGSVVLNDALRGTDSEALRKLSIGEIVLASPDLDPDVFERTHRRLRKLGATSTVYAATRDWALWFSSGLRDLPRLGYVPSTGPTRLIAGSDLIEISAVNTDAFGAHHDLYANSPVIIGDLLRLLKDGRRPPESRTGGFVVMPAPDGMYWVYRAPRPR